MKPKTPKPRNLVLRAMVQTRHGGAHGKTHKQARGNDKAAFLRSLKKEGGFVQRATLAS